MFSPDGGSGHFAATIRALKERIPGVKVEVLVPDFNMDVNAIRTVIEAEPEVYNHNVETVERLTFSQVFGRLLQMALMAA